MIEEWRPAPGFAGFYEVSDMGRVRRSAPGGNSHVGRLKTLRLKRTGYISVGLSVSSIRYESLVHQLVAVAFIGPCPPRRRSTTAMGTKQTIGGAIWNIRLGRRTQSM